MDLCDKIHLQVESLYLRSEDALATDIWRSYTQEVNAGTGGNRGDFSSVSVAEWRENLQKKLGLLILQIAQERLSLLVENMRGSKHEPIARAMWDGIRMFCVPVPPRGARLSTHMANRYMR